MFDNLTKRFSTILKDLTGRGRISEEQVDATLREVRMAFLEADVALPVVKDFVAHIRERAVGTEVFSTLTPGQAMIRIVRDELVKLMGEAEPLKFNAQPPAVFLMAGLQGSGKTTSVGKLSRFLKEKQGKSVVVASCDVYRPAAIEQLGILANEVGAGFFASDPKQSPEKIAKGALAYAKQQFFDVLIVDTAGRLHIDAEMMDEIKRLHSVLNPIETLFVVDSMTGQDAVNTAKAFNDALPLTGVILTKTDGDARGGAALSVRHVTGKPIKFLGVGEKSTALEPFYPDRVASRILGMGDVLGLIEEVESKFNREQTAELANKLKKGKDFDLQDFREQIKQMNAMGGMGSLMKKLPGVTDLPADIDQLGSKEMARFGAIIDSMTLKERRFPDIIKGSRKRRIAAGSGVQVHDINRLLKQFTQMQKMMKQMTKKGGMSKLMRAMGAMKGKIPGMPF